jgi:hypothetical protein
VFYRLTLAAAIFLTQAFIRPIKTSCAKAIGGCVNHSKKMKTEERKNKSSAIEKAGDRSAQQSFRFLGSRCG